MSYLFWILVSVGAGAYYFWRRMVYNCKCVGTAVCGRHSIPTKTKASPVQGMHEIHKHK